ncbi:MAG: histidine kinase [Luteolibacter sp.]
MKIGNWAIWLAISGMAMAEEGPSWVRRLAFWAGPELESLDRGMAGIDRELATLPVLAAVNSGNRIGFQSADSTEGRDLWLEVELASAAPVDAVVLVPLLAKGSRGAVSGFGFPKRFALEGHGDNGESVILMDQRAEDFPNPGLDPVTAACPQGFNLRRLRLTVIEPWRSGGSPVLALSEILMLRGNANVADGATVRSSSSREIPPSWSRRNLVDMMTPLGLPVIPDGSTVMGWHGVVASAAEQAQAVTVDLGRVVELDEIRLVAAWRKETGWDLYYGFPTRFRVETSLSGDFTDAVMVHDQTQSSLQSPGQNLQCFPAMGKPARYVRVTATRLRNRTGDFVFALGELQAYAGDVNVAKGAAVLAGESLESEVWSPAGLTDGSARGGKLLELPDWFRALDRRRKLLEQRKTMAMRRDLVFTRAEHTLVGASVFGAGGIVLIAGVLSWRGHRSRVIERERHRERLARDLHDELGSNLGSIALVSSLAAQEDAAQMRLDLAEIEQMARESADSMRDMVALLGGEANGGSEHWLNVMSGLAGRTMSNVEFECLLPTAPLAWEPNPETRREIYLFCKEVLHNAVRHGNPEHVSFHLSPAPRGLRIEIVDDGRGFDPEGVQGGHGLTNLGKRAAGLGARMVLTSSPGAGTRVLLEVPRGRRWKKC